MTERMLVSTTETTYGYVYDGGQLSQVTITTTVTADDETTTQTDVLSFTYDASGAPQTVTCGENTYLYVTNLQGDVVAILDNAGTSVVEYTYDAWGNLLNTMGSMANALGAHNPLRYRGYVYDTETELYYLQSRYYDPELGRFLNADALVSTGQGVLGNNMFAYCRNNPVSRKDAAGTSDLCVAALDDDGNPFDDLMGLRGGCGGAGGNYTGYAYAYNPIDAAYSYHIDFSSSTYSSLSTGGIYQNGYSYVESYNCPNPGGRKGGEAHRGMVQTIKNQLVNNGFEVIEEYRVNTPGGYKDVRYLDLYATNGQDAFGVQVGQMTKGGAPVARELRALGDISCANIYVVFVAYN